MDGQGTYSRLDEKPAGWKTIDSAPKDGTPIYLFCPDGIDRSWVYEGPKALENVCIGWFGSPHYYYPYPPNKSVWVSTDVQVDVVTYGEYTGSSLEGEQVTVFPTHWQELPEPPSKGE